MHPALQNPPHPPPRPLKRLDEVTKKESNIFSPKFLIAAFVIGCVSVTLIRPLLRREPPLAEVLFQLPGYTLQNTNEQIFGSNQLTGKVYIAALFFTRCKTVCPKITRAMKKLANQINDGKLDIPLVLITIDPDHDRPDVLAAHAKANGLDLNRIHLLTGDTTKLTSLVVSGFKQHLGDKQISPKGDMEIMHSGKLMLVDKHGGLRGLYDNGDLGIDEIFHRAIHLDKRTH